MIDMNVLRNKEFKTFLLIYLLFTLAAAVIAAIINAEAAGLVFVVCGIGLLLFVLFTRKRYQAISELSSQIDRILHGEYNINLVPDEEGEIAVLSSELCKMTLRLREQADLLAKDKR